MQKKILVILAVLWGTIHSPHCATNSADFPVPDKLMGIEIETSAIKTNVWGSKLIISEGKSSFLILEGDTTDMVFEKAFNHSFDKNVECHTVDGLTYERIRDAAEQTEDLLDEIYRISSTPSHLTAGFFKESLPPRFKTSLDCKDDASTLSFLSVQLEPEKRTIRPQVTFQLRLDNISSIFERLAGLGHLAIKFLLVDLDQETPITARNLPLSSSGHFSKFSANRDKGLPIRNYFRESIAHDFKEIPFGPAKVSCDN